MGMAKVISWNIARREAAWRYLINLDADVAVLQEAAQPPADITRELEIDPAPWHTPGAGTNRPWRTAIVRLSRRVEVQWLEAKPLHTAEPGDLAVSRPGTLAAAIVTLPSGVSLVVVSIYALWEKPFRSTAGSFIYADASAHRLISDISALVGQRTGLAIVVAGDLNILHGHGEGGNEYWASRYATVFNRISTLGLKFVGPQAPHGRQANPWPDELPRGSKNVPTYHTNDQAPASATRQLDFVFVSTDLADRVRVRALNEPEEWGPSDHCRVEIEIPE